MASSSTQPGAAANNSVLTPVVTLEGHEPVTHYSSNGEQYTSHRVSSICYFPDGKRIISGSEDKTTRQWDLQAGKEIEEARDVGEHQVMAVAVSRDGRWVVTAGGDGKYRELKVCEVKTGIVRTFEGHSWRITSIDISGDSTLLASGGWDFTRIWNLDTGKLVAGPLVNADGVGAVRFSQDSKKLAVISDVAKRLEVWDVQTQKLDVTLGNFFGGAVICAPVFWTTKDKTMVAAFNYNDDAMSEANRGYDDSAKTIYEFNALTLQTVGAPFEGHTHSISGLSLSLDGTLLASASRDWTIKLWAFESRQLLASFDVQYPYNLIFSPNSHQLAYTTWVDTKIYICDTPPNILATLQSAQEAQPNINAAKKPRPLDFNATRRAVRRIPIQPPIVPRPLRDSTTMYPPQQALLRFLRKMLPSRTNLIRTDDPLDFPVTSPLPPNCSPSAQATTKTRSHMDPNENSRSIPPPLATQASATPLTTFKARLHYLSMWWPVRAGHSLPPIVDVPLAQGKERNAAAGAPPKNSEGWIPDEDYVPSRPPSPNTNSQPLPTTGQLTTGKHGSGRLCGCF